MPRNMEIQTRFTAYDGVSRTLGKIQARVASTIARVNRATRAAARGINNFSSKLTGVVKTGFAGLAVVAGAAALAIKSTAQRMDDLAKLARAINFPIEEFQEWQFVAEQSGVGTEEFQKNLSMFTKNASAAALGLGPLAARLKKIDKPLLKSLKGAKNNAEAFDIMINAMRNAPTEAKRNVLALTAFGRSGTDMINISRMSAEEIEKLKQQMRENGIITAEQAAQAEEFDDMMNRVKLTVGSLLVGVLEPLLPILTDVANEFRKWLTENRAEIIQKIKDGLAWIVENKDDILKWAKNIGIAIASFYALQAAINAVNAVITVASWLSNPYVLIAVAFVAAIGAIWYFRDEIDAFMAYFFDWCAEVGSQWKAVWLAAVDTFYWVFTPLTAFFETVFEALGSIWGIFVDAWNGDWYLIGIRFYETLDSFKAYFVGVWTGIKDFFSGIWEGILSIVQIYRDLINGDFDAIGARFTSIWEGIKSAAGSALDFIIEKITALINSPPFQLLAKVMGLPLATLGLTNNAPDVAGADPNAGAMAGSGPMLPQQIGSSAGGNYNETFDTRTNIQQSTVVIEDKTGRAKPKRGKLPPGVKLKRSAAF